jgi:hypothetical protein
MEQRVGERLDRLFPSLYILALPQSGVPAMAERRRRLAGLSTGQN